jgi:hypothetical protein
MRTLLVAVACAWCHAIVPPWQAVNIEGVWVCQACHNGPREAVRPAHRQRKEAGANGTNAGH